MAHIAFSETDHRPWKHPTRFWRWRQSWSDLLFAHWPVPSKILKPLVPEPLAIQEFNGTSWIGIVPFQMNGVMLRPFPDLPGFSSFPELNVRLYVEYENKPGVWFLSLDATNSLAVWGARKYFHLPYFHADITIGKKGPKYHYRTNRKGNNEVSFEGSYQPVSDPYYSEKGTLEHWLTERYCLYSFSPFGDLFRYEVHHKPWPLQKAIASISENKLFYNFDIQLPEIEPLVHFSKNIDVVIWGAEKVAT